MPSHSTRKRLLLNLKMLYAYPSHTSDIPYMLSSANECEYCQLHHGEALNHYWKDEANVRTFREDFTRLDLSDVDIELCSLAQKLTLKPGQANKTDVQSLTDLGLSDHAVLDATLVISYFNFVNRMVLGLGVETNENEIKGYKY